MKKRIILFTSVLGVAYLALSSYNAGPITGGAGNRTGSQGSTANCSTGSGCHATNTSSTTVQVYLADSATNVPISGGWLPNKTYKINVVGANTTKTHYGFQLSAVYHNGTSEAQAGTFTVPTGSSFAAKPSGNLSIVEHTSKIAYTAGFTITLLWTAPPATVDTVKFYAQVNCVNNDGSTGGDAPNNSTISYYRNTTSVAALNADININAYPNPVKDQLNIEISNADNGIYAINVFDINGKVVASKTAVVNKTFQTSINTSAWAAGMYHVQLSKDGAKKTIAVVKQ